MSSRPARGYRLFRAARSLRRAGTVSAGTACSAAFPAGAGTCTGTCTARVTTRVRKRLFLAGLEVGLVPARTFQTETGGRNALGQRGLATGRAVLQRWVTDLLELLDFGATGFATVLVDGHGAGFRTSRKRRIVAEFATLGSGSNRSSDLHRLCVLRHQDSAGGACFLRCRGATCAGGRNCPRDRTKVLAGLF